MALYASLDENKSIFQKLNSNREIFYHNVCYTTYIKKFGANVGAQREPTSWHKRRALHKSAYDIICNYITTEVLENQKIFLFNDIYLQYQAILFELNCNAEYSFESFTSQHLQEKISKDFSEEIVINFSNLLRKYIIYKKGIDINRLVDNSVMQQITEKEKVRNVAYEMRKLLLNVPRKKLPENLTAEAIIEGECEIPQQLLDFMSFLIKGPSKRRNDNDEDNVRIHSICDDIIYSIHKGRIKPGKHMKLGMTVKSLTNSKKIIQLLNRLGHSIGYTTVEELETEMTYTAYEKNKIIPSSITTRNTQSTRVLITTALLRHFMEKILCMTQWVLYTNSQIILKKLKLLIILVTLK